mmetsp:Transcript_9518/g.21853  ORF Transcript_9518/g.21853 Transcript_9518/m.21853 type:complete len:203 (-) Transcript_9518:105-713(-)
MSSGRIEQVKDKIEKKEGIPSDERRLMFCGRLMEDEQRLGVYSIQNESTVHSSLGLCGGKKVAQMIHVLKAVVDELTSQGVGDECEKIQRSVLELQQGNVSRKSLHGEEPCADEKKAVSRDHTHRPLIIIKSLAYHILRGQSVGSVAVSASLWMWWQRPRAPVKSPKKKVGECVSRCSQILYPVSPRREWQRIRKTRTFEVP